MTLRKAIYLVISSPFFAAAFAQAAENRLELQLPSTKPEVFERVEITVKGLPATTNPFDPQLITLDLDVTPPSGKTVRVPGFFSRDYSRKLEGNREVLTAEGEGGWLVRWLPLEPGRHKLVVSAAAGGFPAAKA